MVDLFMYWLGWLVFVMLQAPNSVRSTSNGLTADFRGVGLWILLNSKNLLARAFLCLCLQVPIQLYVIGKIESPLLAAGLKATTWGLAGMAGLLSCTVIYQILGFFPAFRVELGQIIPPSPATTSATGDTPKAATGN